MGKKGKENRESFGSTGTQHSSYRAALLPDPYHAYNPGCSIVHLYLMLLPPFLSCFPPTSNPFALDLLVAFYLSFESLTLITLCISLCACRFFAMFLYLPSRRSIKNAKMELILFFYMAALPAITFSPRLTISYTKHIFF